MRSSPVSVMALVWTEPAFSFPVGATMTSVIVNGARTPMGRLLGGLKDLPATRLGEVAIRAALERSGISPDQVQYVIMGQVLHLVWRDTGALQGGPDRDLAEPGRRKILEPAEQAAHRGTCAVDDYRGHGRPHRKAERWFGPD